MDDFLADLNTLDELPLLPQETAEYAGLVYIASEEQLTITRRRWGRGFTYLDADGDHIQDKAERERIEAIVIPPAWEEVFIAAQPNAHILAVGRDEAGRKQYRYHPDWQQVRNLTKFNRLALFGEYLPVIRKETDAHVRQRTLSREKVLAIVVRLLESSLIRIGNDAYARSNNSYGLTTMRHDHIEVNSRRISFHFVGKSGKEHEIDVEDRRLAHAIHRLDEALPGGKLFEYIADNGDVCEVTSSDVNAYLREITGEQLSAKDFRTWGGSVLMIAALWGEPMPETDKEAQKVVAAKVKQVAAEMGNTPAVTRKYYIHPIIMQAYEDGTLPEVVLAQPEARTEHDLSRSEAALMALIRQQYE